MCVCVCYCERKHATVGLLGLFNYETVYFIEDTSRLHKESPSPYSHNFQSGNMERLLSSLNSDHFSTLSMSSTSNNSGQDNLVGKELRNSSLKKILDEANCAYVFCERVPNSNLDLDLESALFVL